MGFGSHGERKKQLPTETSGKLYKRLSGRRSSLLRLSEVSPLSYHRRVVATKFTTSDNLIYHMKFSRELFFTYIYRYTVAKALIKSPLALFHDSYYRIHIIRIVALNGKPHNNDHRLSIFRIPFRRKRRSVIPVSEKCNPAPRLSRQIDRNTSQQTRYLFVRLYAHTDYP